MPRSLWDVGQDRTPVFEPEVDVLRTLENPLGVDAPRHRWRMAATWLLLLGRPCRVHAGQEPLRLPRDAVRAHGLRPAQHLAGDGTRARLVALVAMDDG